MIRQPRAFVPHPCRITWGGWVQSRSPYQFPCASRCTELSESGRDGPPPSLLGGLAEHRPEWDKQTTIAESLTSRQMGSQRKMGADRP